MTKSTVLENSVLYNIQIQQFQSQFQKFKILHSISLPLSIWFSGLWQRSKIFLKLMPFTFRIKQDKQLTVFPFAQVTVFLNLLLVILGCLSGNAVNLNVLLWLVSDTSQYNSQKQNIWSISQKKKSFKMYLGRRRHFVIKHTLFFWTAQEKQHNGV